MDVPGTFLSEEPDDEAADEFDVETKVELAEELPAEPEDEEVCLSQVDTAESPGQCHVPLQ